MLSLNFRRTRLVTLSAKSTPRRREDVGLDMICEKRVLGWDHTTQCLRLARWTRSMSWFLENKKRDLNPLILKLLVLP